MPDIERFSNRSEWLESTLIDVESTLIDVEN